MFNNIDAYTEAGEKCALARYQKDESRAAGWRESFGAMLAYEKGDDRKAAQFAFDSAYRTYMTTHRRL